MRELPTLPVRQKVYGYILRSTRAGSQLLVFQHVDFPEAGIQVPGGTVEPGEAPIDAALREAQEETGMNGLAIHQALGTVWRDMRGLGVQEVHHRRYYQMRCPEQVQETWIANEETPSDGSEGPIALRFFWVSLESVPVLLGGMDEMLAKVRPDVEDDFP